MRLKIIKCSTVSISLDILLKGQLNFLNNYFYIMALSGMDNHLGNVKNREKVDVIDIRMERSISIFKDIICFISKFSL